MTRRSFFVTLAAGSVARYESARLSRGLAEVVRVMSVELPAAWRVVVHATMAVTFEADSPAFAAALKQASQNNSQNKRP